MRNLEQSIKPGNYKTLWCAGKSVEQIHDIKPCKNIIDDLMSEFEVDKQEFLSRM
jgi:nitronate monooxygenase